MFKFSFGIYFGLADKQLPSWERSYMAVQELIQLIPNFHRKINEGLPEELDKFYKEVSKIS